MSFPLVKTGGWAFGEKLTSAQMNALDADHANAVDGLNGGSYALAAPLSLTGQPVTIATLTAPSVTGNTTFANNVTVSGTTNVGSLSATGVTCSGTVSGTSGAFSTSFTAPGLQCNSTGIVYATIALRLSTGGGASYDSNVTLTVGSTPQIITIDDGDLTNNRTWTISPTGAQDGNFFLIVNRSTTRSITINSPSVSPLTSVNNAPASTSDEGSGTINYARTAILLYRFASIWHYIKFQER